MAANEQGIEIPYEQLYGSGTAQRWTPGRKPSIRWRAHQEINLYVIKRELEILGFDRAVFHAHPEDPDRRVLALYGEDSPPEYCLEFNPVRMGEGTHDDVDALTRKIVFWARERSEMLKEYSLTGNMHG